MSNSYSTRSERRAKMDRAAKLANQKLWDKGTRDRCVKRVGDKLIVVVEPTPEPEV